MDLKWDKLNLIFKQKKTKINGELLETLNMLKGCELNSQMLINLVNDLLDLATQEKKTFQLNKQYFNLVDSINSAFKTLKYISDSRQVTTSLHVKQKQLRFFEEVFGDANRIQQILLNFISNSMKFTKQGGFVKVVVGLVKVRRVMPSEAGLDDADYSIDAQSFEDNASRAYITKVESPNIDPNLEELAQSPNKHLLVWPENSEVYLVRYFIKIQDNGAGMSPENLMMLFKTFSKLEDKSKINTTGTGLGLSICKQLLERLGGKV